jgi:hypothetical protein
MDKFNIQIDSSQPRKNFEKMPADVRGEMVDAAKTLKDEAVNYARTLASGPLVNVRSGRYLRSIKGRVSSGSKTVTGKIFSNAPEAHLIEQGATRRPREILPNAKQALAFMIGGKRVFAKAVHHPGSIMPAKHLLQQTIDDMQPDIFKELEAALNRGLNK